MAMIEKDVAGPIVDPEAYLFFRQRIQELTFHYALDSYKAASLNAPFLAVEALEQLEYTKASGKGIKSLEIILDELRDRLSGNEVSGRLLRLSWEKYCEFDLANLDDLNVKLRILSDHIAPSAYLATIRTLLLEVLAYPKEKKRLSGLASELVTTLVNCGVSSSHIHASVKSLLKRPALVRGDLDSIMNYFLDRIMPIQHNYTVCTKVILRGNALGDEHFERFGVEISQELRGPFSQFPLDHSVKKLEANESFAKVSGIRAVDAHSAVNEARERIFRLIDSAKLFDHLSSCSIHDGSLIEQCCIDTIYQARNDRNRMSFISNPFPRENAKMLLNLLDEVTFRGEELQKFFRAVDFHGASVSTGVLQNQLLNLWICFESICQTHRKKSIIENIEENVIPIIGLRYFERKLSDAFAMLNSRCRPAFERAISELSLPGDLDRRQTMLSLLFDPASDESLRRLGGSLGDLPLVKFRLFEIKQDFMSPKRLARAVSAHNSRVGWQIKRIYRTRNSIVHTGRTPSFCGPLVENSHDYFDQIFSTVCEFSKGMNGLRSFDQCFAFGRRLLEERMKIWSESNAGIFDLRNDLFI